jgi:hypothetical protein
MGNSQFPIYSDLRLRFEGNQKKPATKTNLQPHLTRRDFLQRAAFTATALTALHPKSSAANPAGESRPIGAQVPWYRRTYRWGQTNITEKDPSRYDIPWWRNYWKQTQVQGVIINAGGIVAYYPSKYPLQHRAEYLFDRDLYGELAKAAHDDGLIVLARMDSNRAGADFIQAHPDWFAVNRAGKPYRAGELYVACVNSPYYDEYIPDILREIIDRTHPEGLTDNSWSGLGRDSICYCPHCARKFRERTGRDIPLEKNWNDPGYRAWIQWNYVRRLEIWDLNNRVTRAAGGPDCLWIGMNSGSISSQAASFRDYKEICRRAEIIMLDHQARSDSSGFQQNGETGKLIHGLLGWDKLIPESMAMYQAGRSSFRLAAKPEPEVRLWMVDGIAGGIQPWWHHVGAVQEDRRMFRTAEPLYRWHRANQEFLVNRRPLATVGVLWSQQNTDFYGRDNSAELVELPFRGVTQALNRARIPYLPVHVDHLERDAKDFSLLILPNLAAMSDAQVASVRQFVAQGGNLLATNETSLCNEWGDARADYALADLFGAHLAEPVRAASEANRRKRAVETLHTYLRLAPSSAARAVGPHDPTEPPVTGERHPALRGFEETDLLPFGGVLEPLKLEAHARVLLTYVPPFPVYPPETAWMRQPQTDIPGLILNTTPSSGRVAFLPADIDRRFARDNFPDHANLLANLVRWLANDQIPLTVTGPGLVDCHLYRQPGKLILHLVNLTNAGTWRAPVDELVPVGPLHIRVKLPEDVTGNHLRLLVSLRDAFASVHDGWSEVEVQNVLDHEVLVFQ